MEELDPDPELDALEDFELGWKTATGALWRKAGCDGIDFGVGDEDMAKGGLVASDEVEGERSSKAGTSRAATEEAEEVIRSRRLLKGKFKAVPDISPDVHRRGNDTVIPSTHPDTTTAPSEVPISWPISGISPSQTPHKAADTARNSGDMAVAAGVLDASPDWVEESKRRKAPWRRLIRSDSSFGAFWDNLPRVSVARNALSESCFTFPFRQATLHFAAFHCNCRYSRQRANASLTRTLSCFIDRYINQRRNHPPDHPITSCSGIIPRLPYRTPSTRICSATSGCIRGGGYIGLSRSMGRS